ncbi:hypothetical protein KI387_036293, partial [Taxus chinensis]
TGREGADEPCGQEAPRSHNPNREQPEPPMSYVVRGRWRPCETCSVKSLVIEAHPDYLAT